MSPRPQPGVASAVANQHEPVDRRVSFDGAQNFRDLGGYETAGGGRTRFGLVFRADSLHKLSDTDLELYEALHIQAVYDLRRGSERELRPNRVPSRNACVVTPIEEAGVEPIDRSVTTDERSGEQVLQTMYESMLRQSGRVFGDIFTGLAAPQGVPAVFHCHAGKDRTGIVAALLLEALQVPRPVVLDDYEVTALYRLREHQQGSFDSLVASGMQKEAAVGMLGAPRWAMEQTLDRLDDEFGGIERYLAKKCSLSEATVARLRQQLVEF